MQTIQTNEIELLEGRGRTDKTQRGRFDFPLHVGMGAAASAVVYFEVAPGEHSGRHTHSAEEIAYIVEGTAELEVGDEREKAEAGALALIPTMVPHDVHNVGITTVKLVGFFAAAGVITKFEDAFEPFGTDTFIIGMAPQEAPIA